MIHLIPQQDKRPLLPYPMAVQKAVTNLMNDLESPEFHDLMKKYYSAEAGKITTSFRNVKYFIRTRLDAILCIDKSVAQSVNISKHAKGYVNEFSKL